MAEELSPGDFRALAVLEVSEIVASASEDSLTPRTRYALVGLVSLFCVSLRL